MTKKSAKIASLLADITLPHVAQGHEVRFDPHYLGYFECFNRQMYYEAHDVLEDLWLQTKDHDHFFYKGLIQLAGAFVHLKKSKLNPAARLFQLVLKNLTPYSPTFKEFDVHELIRRVKTWLSLLEDSSYTKNPYHPDSAPQLRLKE